MATATLERKSESKVGALMKTLQDYISEFDAISTRRDVVWTQIFETTYDLVMEFITDGRATHTNDAFAKIGNTIRKTRGQVSQWYYCGLFMRTNNFAAATHDARSIRLVFNRFGILTKAEGLRAIQAIKDRRDFKQVKRIVTHSKQAACVTAERKTDKLVRDRQLTRSRLRMELMAVKTMARAFFKDDGLKVQVVLSSGKVGESM